MNLFTNLYNLITIKYKYILKFYTYKLIVLYFFLKSRSHFELVCEHIFMFEFDVFDILT